VCIFLEKFKTLTHLQFMLLDDLPLIFSNKKIILKKKHTFSNLPLCDTLLLKSSFKTFAFVVWYDKRYWNNKCWWSAGRRKRLLWARCRTRAHKSADSQISAMTHARPKNCFISQGKLTTASNHLGLMVLNLILSKVWSDMVKSLYANKWKK
jgi:hypothetical protein